MEYGNSDFPFPSDPCSKLAATRHTNSPVAILSSFELMLPKAARVLKSRNQKQKPRMNHLSTGALSQLFYQKLRLASKTTGKYGDLMEAPTFLEVSTSKSVLDFSNIVRIIASFNLVKEGVHEKTKKTVQGWDRVHDVPKKTGRTTYSATLRDTLDWLNLVCCLWLELESQKAEVLLSQKSMKKAQTRQATEKLEGAEEFHVISRTRVLAPCSASSLSTF
ncbi:hypothetical protein BT69DRAFT_1295290 [Atractiella rhizophila]|nr:hypothetical protein BT69DRAFT_1295290 [Atractiella rhizophila]